MDVSLPIWIATIVVVIGFICFDFYSHVRKPHAPSMKEATGWMVFYIVLAVAFGAFLWLNFGGLNGNHRYGVEFFAGYITELSLSVDNLFIFALIISAFKVPRDCQQKVLLIGIAIALVLRGIFIGVGAAAIAKWSAIFYIFGIFLVYTAAKLIIDEVKHEPDPEVDSMLVVRMVRRVIHVSSEFDGDKLVTTSGGKKMVTPMVIALVSIGFIDLMFAFDSVPAIFGLTQEPFIVFTTNAFALMGLRQMYFLLDGLLDRLVYLAYGLGVILAFIGIKLVLHALHENNIPFINGGAPLHVVDVPTELSLIVIVVVLAITAVASLAKTKHDEKAASRAEG